MSYNMNTQKNQYEKSPFTVREISGWKIEQWAKRKISKDTMEWFGVRSGYDQHDGKQGGVRYIAFPYYSSTQKTKLIGYKVLDQWKSKEESGYFTVVGTVNTKCQLFGQNKANYKTKKIFITEGEADTLAVFEAITKNLKGSKWEGMKPTVCSIQLGTPNAVSSVTEQEDFITLYQSIILVFDNDRRKENEPVTVIRGVEAAEEVGSHLCSNEVYTVRFPDDIKDACDLAEKDRFKELNDIVSFNTVKFKPEKIVEICEALPFEEFLRPIPIGWQFNDAFPILNDKLMGIRPRELTVSTALSGIGKSSLGSEIAYQLAKKSGVHIGLIMLEENLKKTVSRFVARDLEVHPNRFKFDMFQKGTITKDQIKQAYDWTNDMFHPLSHYGAIKTNYLMGLVKNLYYTKKCQFILLDHISLMMSDADIKDKVQEIDVAMEKLGTFCSSNDVHVMVVSHLNRNASKDMKPKKGKEDEPYWVSVSKEDLRGSSSLEGVAWNIIGISNEIMPDRSRGRIRLDILKNREADKLGVCDITKMNENTGKFFDAS